MERRSSARNRIVAAGNLIVAAGKEGGEIEVVMPKRRSWVERQLLQWFDRVGAAVSSEQRVR